MSPHHFHCSRTKSSTMPSSLLWTLGAAAAICCPSYCRAHRDRACAEIAGQYRAWHHLQDGSLERQMRWRIPGQLAFDCLRAMPFNATLATAFINAYRPYLLFHSTLDVLPQAPPEYLSPSVDLLAGLAKIGSRAARGDYESHFDFDSDLNRLLSLAHDGHLQIELCSQHLFLFTRDLPLVSISDDGLKLPSIYTFDDAQRRGAHHLDHVSPVVEINGMDAAYYLESHVAMWLNSHDPDARYNHLFPSAAAHLSGAYAGGAWTRYKGKWPGTASSRLKFANGSYTTVDTHASWPAENGPMLYENGPDLFTAACLPTSVPPTDLKRIPTGTGYDTASPPHLYPEPDVEHSDTPVKVYYLASARLSDVAVLQVPSFKARHGGSNYTTATEHILQHAVTEGKTKLIIDLSDNGGGDVELGLNLFRLLFPGRDVYSATRFRAHDLVDVMGQIFSKHYSAPGQAPVDLTILPHDAVNPAQEHVFHSWATLYGPDEYRGTNMSRLYALFHSSATSTCQTPASREDCSIAKSHPPFRPQDIIMVSQ
ncbi:Peptidase S41 family protein ustP [Fulvia fulva]|nr:Peptidase S41 family protein ustP [Fulvia fulva]